MTPSRLSKYPAVYSKIVLACPLDGTPLQITLDTEALAKYERLQFYNFLKFVRRNPRECAHLLADNRANEISVSLQGRVLSFTIRGSRSRTSLDEGFDQAVSAIPDFDPAAAIQVPILQETSRAAVDELYIPGLDDPSAPQINPLDLLKQHMKGEKK